jgi:hypothetical protein
MLTRIRGVVKTHRLVAPLRLLLALLPRRVPQVPRVPRALVLLVTALVTVLVTVLVIVLLQLP